MVIYAGICMHFIINAVVKIFDESSDLLMTIKIIFKIKDNNIRIANPIVKYTILFSSMRAKVIFMKK